MWQTSDQAGGRAFLFLRTCDFRCDHRAFAAPGNRGAHAPNEADFGMVAVFKDLFGNLLLLVEFTHRRTQAICPWPHDSSGCRRRIGQLISATPRIAAANPTSSGRLRVSPSSSTANNRPMPARR